MASRKAKQLDAEDPFLQGFENAKQYYDRNKFGIITLIVVAIVASLAVYGYRWSKQSTLEKSSVAFSDAFLTLQKGDTTAAVEQLRNVQQRYSSTPHGYYAAYMLGNVLLAQADYAGAEQWFAIAQDAPDNTLFIAGAASSSRAVAFEYIGDVQAAIENVQQAMKDPGYAHAWGDLAYRLALLRHKQGQKEQALSLLEKIQADTTYKALHSQVANLKVEWQSAN